MLVIFMYLQRLTLALAKVWQVEKMRYRKKGFKGIVIALILLLGIMQLFLRCGSICWPQKIINSEMFILVGSISIYFVAQTIGLIFYFPGYLGTFQFYNDHLITNMKMQPKTLKYKKPNKDFKEYAVIIKKLIINQLILIPIGIFLIKLKLINTEVNEFPNLLTFFCQIQIMYFFQDLVGFLGHKISHSYSLFNKMHKIHHDFNTVQWWISEYFHPLEPVCASYFMSLFIYALTGTKIHCIVIFSWIWWKNIVNTENHAGYQFQWSPTRIMPFVADPSYHVYHHDNHMENYGASCYIWDLFFESNTHYLDNFLKN